MYAYYGNILILFSVKAISFTLNAEYFFLKKLFDASALSSLSQVLYKQIRYLQE